MSESTQIEQMNQDEFIIEWEETEHGTSEEHNQTRPGYRTTLEGHVCLEGRDNA